MFLKKKNAATLTEATINFQQSIIHAILSTDQTPSTLRIRFAEENSLELITLSSPAMNVWQIQMWI